MRAFAASDRKARVASYGEPRSVYDGARPGGVVTSGKSGFRRERQGRVARARRPRSATTSTLSSTLARPWTWGRSTRGTRGSTSRRQRICAPSGSRSVLARRCAIGSSPVGPRSEVLKQERLSTMRLNKLVVALAALSILSFAIFSDALFAQRKVDPASAAPADIRSRNVADPHALEEQLKSVASKVTPCAVAVGGGQLGGSGVIVSADGLVLTQSHCAPNATESHHRPPWRNRGNCGRCRA